MNGTVANILPPIDSQGGCDGSSLYSASLRAPLAGAAKEATFEGGPWNCFLITASKLEDWIVPQQLGASGLQFDFDFRLDDGATIQAFAGSWVRTAPFTKFYVKDRRAVAFSAVAMTVFLTRAPGFFAFCMKGWY